MQEVALNFTYVIQFVADMDQAVTFFKEVLGLELKYKTPYWSEFATGATTLALHPATTANPPGKVQLGFGVPDLVDFYKRLSDAGIIFTQPPTREEGSLLARFLDVEGNEINVGEG